MKVEYKGYVIEQSKYNNHIMIFKDNKMVMHISATKKFSESELKSIVNFWLI